MKRIGVLVPAENASIEYDLWKMSPVSVTVHSTRFVHEEGWEPTDVESFRENLKRSFELLEPIADVLIYGLTFGSHTAAEVIKKSSTKHVVIPEEAAVAMMRELGYRRVWVATPYAKDRMEEESSWFKSKTFEVVGNGGLETASTSNISNISTLKIYDMLRANYTRVMEADVIYIACTALRTFEIAKLIHDEFQKPVISENVAAMWEALKLLGIESGIFEQFIS
ncbi:MAG: arylmalonate decarboxylase [Thermoprotei archaeon]